MAKYRTGALAPESLLDADDHLTECQECRARLSASASGAGVRAWVSGLQEHDQRHLTYEQLRAKLDRQLSPDEAFAVESHLRSCAECQSDWEDLRQFQTKLTPLAVKRPMRIQGWFSAVAAALILALGLWRFAESRRAQVDQPALTASLHDAGGLIGIDADGAVKAPGALTPEDRQLLAQTLASRALPYAPTPSEFAAGQAVLRGYTDTPSFAVVGPLNQTVLSDRPEFHWQALPGAASYRVEVFNSQFKKVASSRSLTGTSWTPERPLERGQSYQWQVVAEQDGKTVRSPEPPAPEARFRVLDESEAARLARIEAIQPRSHLLLAAAYARAGLKTEAQREAQALEKENPGSPLAKSLTEAR